MLPRTVRGWKVQRGVATSWAESLAGNSDKIWRLIPEYIYKITFLKLEGLARHDSWQPSRHRGVLADRDSHAWAPGQSPPRPPEQTPLHRRCAAQGRAAGGGRDSRSVVPAPANGRALRGALASAFRLPLPEDSLRGPRRCPDVPPRLPGLPPVQGRGFCNVSSLSPRSPENTPALGTPPVRPSHWRAPKCPCSATCSHFH